MIDTDKWIESARISLDELEKEVKRLREELDGREAYIKRLSQQLARATKWAYQQVCHNDSAMMDFDDYVWGEEE
jgi:predicted  nucleic acid-binding Zn-ribbon protein